ncbi:uncharacterized protein LOC116349169 [Contarinia nasturtii]|uniref:uncharacterized protein LOC116349169 n=1 Tax=Contarinia nasturtii TaxID=265458 RepID=UPI0012D4406F|nr:uncharacterized protein LOC116349169 [Contarinia nasturtii]
MAFKLNIVVFVLFVWHVCLSARIPRQRDVNDDANSLVTNKNEKSNDVNEISLQLDFEKIQNELEKALSDNEKNELGAIISDMNEAKTVEDGLNGAMKLIEFGVKMAMNHTNIFEPSINSTSPGLNALQVVP